MELKDTESNYTLPDLECDEKDKTPKWYADCIRYFSTFYNKPFNQFNENTTDYWKLTPVEQMVRWFSYYLGRQDNLNFNHIIADGGLDNTGGVSVQNTWRAGQKIPQLVNHLDGNITKILKDLKLETRALSKDAKNRKLSSMEDAMIKFDMAPLFNALEQKYGVAFNPPMGNKNAQTKEELQRWWEYDAKEQGETYAQDIANFLFTKNRGYEHFRNNFKHAVIGGLCATERYVENGFVKFKAIPCWNLIWDNRKESDWNYGGRFRGYLERMTVPEILSRWPDQFTDPEKAQLKKLAKQGDSNFLEKWNNSPNLKWYSLKPNSDTRVGEVGVVTMYWVALRDTRYSESVDNFGVSNVIRLNDNRKRNKGRKGDYWVLDVYKGTLVGNKFLVDFGLCNNVVRDAFNQSDPELPIDVYIPNMTIDQYRSYVSRLHELQDELDLYDFKIRELVGRDLGKNYIVNGNKLGMVSPRDLMRDFKAMGISVQDGTSGEESDFATNQRIVEAVDLTLDSNIIKYVELKAAVQRTMEEIVSIPNVALGQQQSALGLGVQEGILAQSSLGNTSLYEGFIKYMQNVLQNATNMQKNVFCIDGNEDAEMVLGERGLYYIKQMGDFLFENFGIYLSIRNIIDDQKRQKMLDIAFNLSQNGQIDMLDYLKIENATNMIDLENYFEYALKKKKREAEEQQMMAAQQAQAMQQDKLAAQQQNTQMIQENENARNDKRIGLEAAKSMTDAEVRQQQIAAQLAGQQSNQQGM